MAKLSENVINAVSDNKFDSGSKKETLINPDTVPSGATAEPADTTTSGTKKVSNVKYGRRGNDPIPKPDLPEARPELFDDQKNAEKNLSESRKSRDEFIETARQNKRDAKRNTRTQSILPDEFDLDFDDEFDSTDPFVNNLFRKGKINKLLKDQIKEQYPDKIAEITKRIKDDPSNAGLSGKEIRKLINEEVKQFVTPLWKDAGGDTQVNRLRLSTPIAVAIGKIVKGEGVPESVKKVMSDKRAALEKKQNRSLKDQMFLDAFSMAEKELDTANKTAELKGSVKNARENLTAVNKEVKQHKAAVEKARDSFYKGGRKASTVHRNGWDFTNASGGGGAAQYASRVENRDGKKMYVTYSVTGGSPDTNRDPVNSIEYSEYQGDTLSNPNVRNVEGFAIRNTYQVVGGTKGEKAEMVAANNERTFEVLDGQNYFTYSKAHKVMAPKILKVIIDLGGKIDRNTGKIYSVSKGDFPEGAEELFLDYTTAKKISGGNDEEVAKLTGMSLEEVKATHEGGMVRRFKLGDARVTQDAQGRLVYQLPADNKTVISGKQGRQFYINWNEPSNRKKVAEYAEKGISKQDIPIEELKTVNTSRSTEGNIDWTDKAKTKAAEKAQRDRYTGAYKPSADVLDALIGFGRNK